VDALRHGQSTLIGFLARHVLRGLRWGEDGGGGSSLFGVVVFFVIVSKRLVSFP
jgi:hypothetical protein